MRAFAKLCLMLILSMITGCSWISGFFGNGEKEAAQTTQTVENAAKAKPASAEAAGCGELDAGACYTAAKKLLVKDKALTNAMALVLFIQACDKSSAAACQQAGVMFQQGEGTGRDAKQAVDWFVKACDTDRHSGCYEAGDAYQQGTIVQPDEAKAKQYFAEACRHGVATDKTTGQACTQAGLILQAEGAADKKDIQAFYSAFDFFQEACKAGNGEGCFQAAQSYRSGKGVAPSEDYARQYYITGCDAQYGESCYWAGNLTADRDPEQASQFYYTGCSYNNTDACFELAERYRLGKAITKNLKLAQITYQQICSPTQAIACYWAARLQQDAIEASDKKPEDGVVESLLASYKTACNANLALACYQLALITRQAVWTKADPPAVAQYLSAHCSKQEWLGCYDLALLYKSGDGVMQNQQKAVDLLKQICDVTEENAITLQLEDVAGQIAKSGQWQLQACWRVATALSEYPLLGPALLKGDAHAKSQSGESEDKDNGASGEQLPKAMPVAKDNKSALVYYKKTCDMGAVPACLMVAVALDTGAGGVVEKDPKQAFDYYSKSCTVDALVQPPVKSQDNVEDETSLLSPDKIKQAVANGCYNLGVDYRDAIGTVQDTPKANTLFKRSCTLGQAMGCFNYALGAGEGEKAIYFQRACDRGISRACSLLGATQ